MDIPWLPKTEKCSKTATIAIKQVLKEHASGLKVEMLKGHSSYWNVKMLRGPIHILDGIFVLHNNGYHLSYLSEIRAICI